jgi:hypothetical protein
MDYATPYSSREEFIHAIACLSVVHMKEMPRTGSLRMPLSQLLLNATTGAKCGWYFNNIVHRRTVPPAHLPLLPCGTTANEALHNELAQAMRQTIRPPPLLSRVRIACPSHFNIKTKNTHPSVLTVVSMRLHQSTLALKLQIFRSYKVLAHHYAKFRPTTRQMLPAHIVSRVVSCGIFTVDDWLDYTAEARLYMCIMFSYMTLSS